MDTNYKDLDKKILLSDWESRLIGQQQAMKNCETEMMRHEREIMRLKETMDSLKIEIEKTLKQIDDIKNAKEVK